MCRVNQDSPCNKEVEENKTNWNGPLYELLCKIVVTRGSSSGILSQFFVVFFSKIGSPLRQMISFYINWWRHRTKLDILLLFMVSSHFFSSCIVFTYCFCMFLKVLYIHVWLKHKQRQRTDRICLFKNTESTLFCKVM